MKTFHSLVVVVMALLLLGAAKKPKAKMNAAKPEKPELTRIEPRGIQGGIATEIKLTGTNLSGIKQIKFSNTNLSGELIAKGTNAMQAWIKVLAGPNISRGAYDLSVATGRGESGKIKLYVDDLPHTYETTNQTASASPLKPPFTYWGTLNPAADVDELQFSARSGDSLVIDTGAKSVGSKANINIAVFDATGNLVVSQNTFEGGDPLIPFNVPRSGVYKLRISEETMGGSPDHVYRISISDAPFVTGIFPLSLRTNAEVAVELSGYNLPKERIIRFNGEKIGEKEVPIDADTFRIHKPLKVMLSDKSERLENEPNDSPGQAPLIQVPSVINARIWNMESPAIRTKNKQSVSTKTEDVDFFWFEAKSGQVIIIETDAAQRGSPVDTKIEILGEDGRPVERVLLQAVRDSMINFRSVDSITGDVRVENWEEMELNQYMYLRGEVCKIFRMPEGPDSGFQFYRNAGKRIAYFDTTAAAHALDEPCYVVEPHAPGTKLVPNGLPLFTLHYVNDDDGERKIGSDSRLYFTAPETGKYMIRVTDSRGFSGERHAYRLIIRDPAPGFEVTLGGNKPAIAPGTGQEITFTADRIDGFDDAITVTVTNLPEGFAVSAPVVIEAGHLVATATITASPEVKEPTSEQLAKISIIATGNVNGQEVAKSLKGFEKITVAEKPKLLVAIEPYNETDTNFNVRGISDKPMEVEITPGETASIWLKMKRQGHEDLVNFLVRNLPHGVIVDNVGLNGVLIPKGENERHIFLRCAKWVPETERLIYCQGRQAGNPTSLPVLLRVRKPAEQQTVKN